VATKTVESKYLKQYYHRVGRLYVGIARTRNIIESVDSICRDSADTQYMLIMGSLS